MLQAFKWQHCKVFQPKFPTLFCSLYSEETLAYFFSPVERAFSETLPCTDTSSASYQIQQTIASWLTLSILSPSGVTVTWLWCLRRGIASGPWSWTTEMKQMLHLNKRAFFDEWKRRIMGSGWCFCHYCFPRAMLSLLAQTKWKEQWTLGFWWRDSGTGKLWLQTRGQASYRCWWHCMNMTCLKHWISIITLLNVLSWQ